MINLREKFAAEMLTYLKAHPGTLTSGEREFLASLNTNDEHLGLSLSTDRFNRLGGIFRAHQPRSREGGASTTYMFPQMGKRHAGEAM